ncbi:stage IV sporulation protein A [uncultured Subdoligranulum sp.]|uniref:stage IV sporulation protein A n=1 Tax=uncultured Subdoligranulum sp. TaxID=512298 RepID=UPI002616A0B6|nr:stage IV sporulation protein A [uncultured Subdoligranulum sp.]
MTQEQIYQNIAQRTGGDIYLGVVGPVRSGKSTFIKRFSELMLLPHIQNEARRARANDELPQSAAGRTIMTTEPKFIPEKAVTIELSGGGSFRARLIDCVGYMVEGALGHEENDAPRLVKSPWFDHEVPFDLAAETGTRRVIREHATVGVVVTTDGSVADLPREGYCEAEQRIVEELEAIGKPYIILLNCAEPESDEAQQLAAQMAELYHHAVFPINCVTMTADTIDRLLQTLLYEFPVQEIAVYMPSWVTMLEAGHWLQSTVYSSMLAYAGGIRKMADVAGHRPQLDCEYIVGTSLTGMDLATGTVRIAATIAPDIFYKILGEQTGLEIVDEASLLPCVVSLARAKRAYDKIKSALEQVEATGYGIVMPSIDELTLEEPEIVRQGGQYGVRLSASAPSLHIMRANIHTELSPTVGSEQQGEELIKSLLADFETDPGKLWSTNIFGKSLNELVSEGVQAKLLHMPQEARNRLQQTLERIINEGCDGLICILL